MKSPSQKTLEIKYTLEVQADDTPVRGNVCASGNEDFDRGMEDEILDRLANGDKWAWATVIVWASVDGCPIRGSASLGECSYENKEEFLGDAYYKDLCDEAKRDLLEALANVVAVSERLGSQVPGRGTASAKLYRLL